MKYIAVNLANERWRWALRSIQFSISNKPEPARDVKCILIFKELKLTVSIKLFPFPFDVSFSDDSVGRGDSVVGSDV
jgi:hypothetical protein